jgi:hypothetical protein
MTDEEANILLNYPGAGKHEAIDLYKFKHESPKHWKIQNTKDLGIRLARPKKNDSPSSATYKTEDAFRST